jgi:hypothetical protein
MRGFADCSDLVKMSRLSRDGSAVHNLDLNLLVRWVGWAFRPALAKLGT